ncbi:MAG: HAMP domain-containing protein, partial [Gammaproteobacteria bacterium]|nr:HAMP domain-containing protein [Gammaproteobacteria bacterium]MBT5747362.1 HAMP domain-containing protein [Gammaproteobacteria bacterium]MBT7231371.1 HAMP domain-containing protein [Gammaproteobacteria bacterium]
MLNDLSIRNKIILLLLFPILGLILLSTLNIADKWSKQQMIEQTQELVNLSQSLDHLAHNMAVERGLSAGFLGSKGTELGEEVKQQRAVVDQAVSQLQQFLSKYESPDSAIDNSIQALLQHVEQRNTIRSAIDALAPDNGGFAYYSTSNSQTLELIDRISGMVTEGSLARQLRALSSSLWIKERIGQERGMMNGIFASGLYSNEKMLTVRGFIADQSIYLKTLESNINPSQRTLWEEKQGEFDQAAYQEMRETVFSKGKKVSLITQLQSVIGYGGMIHNFKNYVLKKQPRFRRKVLQQHKQATAILQTITELPGTTTEEKSRISDLLYVLDKYKETIELAKKQKVKGEELERLIDIVDRPALLAIKALATQIEGVSANDWFALATQRIGIFKAVANQISEDTSQQTQSLVDSTRRSLLMNIIFSTLVLIVVAWLGLMISRRLICGIRSVGSAMTHIATNGHFDHQVDVTGEDELGLMASSINNHLLTLKNAIG